MNTPLAHLKHIARLRKQHTANAKAHKWRANEAVSLAIRCAWDAFNDASDQSRVRRLCFTCKTGGTILTLEPHKELFCSDECSREYGIVKGQT